MTLTEMIKAHDGASDSAPLYQAILDFKWPSGLRYWEVADAIFGDDLNAAWRLLAPGWEWVRMDDHGGIADWTVIAFGPEMCARTGTHKSLPCAMVLAALKTHEVE